MSEAQSGITRLGCLGFRCAHPGYSSFKATAGLNKFATRLRSGKPIAVLAFCLFQESDNLLPRDRWKTCEKVIDRLTRFEIIEQRLHGNPRAGKYRRAIHDLGAARYDGLFHFSNLLSGAAMV